jgi:hypothetical protein
MISRSEKRAALPALRQGQPGGDTRTEPVEHRRLHALRRLLPVLDRALPFYTTDDGRAARCDCDVCTGKVPMSDEIPPEGRSDG